MSVTEKSEVAPSDCCLFRLCTKTFRRTIFLLLFFAALLGTLEMINNWEDILRMDISESPDLLQTTNDYTPRPWKQHSRSSFLLGKSFNATEGRTVDDIWHGSRDPKHKFYSTLTVLDNPVTLDGKDGKDVCVPASDWQKSFYPTCNSFHEMVFRRSDEESEKQSQDHVNDGVFMEFLGSGKSRDAWKVKKNDEAVVLKTLRNDNRFAHEIYFHQRVDAVASERLTSSPYVIDIYGFCGTSVMNELGIFYDKNENLSLPEKLRYSRDLAAGVADMHGIDGASNAMIVHSDVRRGNVMFTSDKSILKLSDFNRGFFLGWNQKDNEPCGYQRPVLNRTPRRDKFSAPEETYRQVLTEKSDIYHMGGMLFFILAGKRPFTFNDESEVTKSKQPLLTDKWTMPDFPESIQTSNDPSIKAMRKAVRACLRYQQEERASAKEVLAILNDAMASMEAKS